MDELQVAPWTRYGHDRLYVNLPDGRSAAWFDRRTGQLSLLLDVDEQAVRAALAPHLAAPASSAGRQPRQPAGARPAGAEAAEAGRSDGAAADAVRVQPDAVQAEANRAGVDGYTDDLAANPPGAAIHAKLAELKPGFWRSLADRLLRRDRPETEGWRKGLAGEQMVAAELEPLTDGGWRVLHSIPLPRGVDIDHLLVGPGGVFTVNAKYHRGSRIWVGDEAVTIGGRPYPYTRKSRAEARRASAALSRACGFSVAVAGVLAFVEADTLTVVPTLKDVYATHHNLLGDVFAGASGVWQPEHIETIYTSARDRRTWLDV
jgi:hypothetical protein